MLQRLAQLAFRLRRRSIAGTLWIATIAPAFAPCAQAADDAGIALDPSQSAAARVKAIEKLAARGDAAAPEVLTRIFAEEAAPDAVQASALAAAAKLKLQNASPAVEKRLSSGPVEVRLAALDALGQLRGAAAGQLVVPLVEDADPEVRGPAVRWLGQYRFAGGVPALLAASAKSELREDAILALARIEDPRALAAYLDGLVDKNPTVKKAARAALVSLREAVADDVVHLAERNELSPAVRAELRRVFDSPRFAFLAQSLPAKLDPSAYRDYALTHEGDVQRGKGVFFDSHSVGCTKCHSIGGIGGKIGPDLAGIGGKQSREELVRSILEPSARVASAYRMTTIVTTAGLIHSGIVKSETATAVELVNLAGRAVSIPTGEIDDRQTSPLSLMPNGLKEGLSLDNLTDVATYLESLK